MIISGGYDPTLKYPSPEDYFSPDCGWPEYQFGHLSRKPNAVYSSIRKCLVDACLDKVNIGKPTWNPLGEYIFPGSKVFLLCNFVEQNNREALGESAFAKCTHGSVIRAVMDYVIIALRGHGFVDFGNAPLQSCDWGKVIEQTGASRVQKFFSEIYRGDVKTRLIDLRQHIVKRHILGGVTVQLHDDDRGNCLAVDLGDHSLLEPLFHGANSPRLRVLDYDPRRTAICHDKGKHIYLINREIIDSDVIISIPKLKTHEKVGITCGIKGCVGTVAHKDCLAHHRFGPPSHGGDEYPNSLSAFRAVSAIHDFTYSRKPGVVRALLHSVDYFSRKIVRRFSRAPSGSWPGNDTCWRMAVDLARILEYADKNGTLQQCKQRVHLMMTDGIISGEGDGPLSPTPVHLGYWLFTDNIALGDYINAKVMGFNYQKLPIVREALRIKEYPLFDGDLALQKLQINGQTVSSESINGGLKRKFIAPREWREVL